MIEEIKKLYRPDEVADLLGISKSSLNRLLRRGAIKSHDLAVTGNVRARRRFSQAQIDNFLSARERY